MVSAEVGWAGTGCGVLVPLSWLCSVAPWGHCWGGDPPALTPVRAALWVWLVAGCWAGSGEVRLPLRTSLDGMFGGLLATDASWFRAIPLFCVDFGHTDVPLALSGTSPVWKWWP